MQTYWINSFTGGATHPLFVKQFQLRKVVFIDDLKWNLTTKGIAEVDQYDTPFASYCIVVQDGQLVASLRVLPTNIELGTTSYMIRDASLGRLGADLPPEMCSGFSPPCSASVWEATRLTVAPNLSKELKKKALRSAIYRMITEATKSGVEQLLAIGGVELPIGVRTAGYQIQRLTPFHTTVSGKIAIFDLPVVHL